MHTLWISTHVTQPSNHLCALEEGRGGELVWPPELVDVVPPSFQERDERYCNPLGIDLLVPKRDKSWGCDAVAGEATDVANPE